MMAAASADFDQGSAVVMEARKLTAEALTMAYRCEMSEPDLNELLRMIQECRRFIAIPMPEESIPF